MTLAPATNCSSDNPNPNPNPNPFTTLNQKPNDNPRSYSLSPKISQEQLSPDHLGGMQSTDLPTSTFLSYFKGKYGSTFFPAKIRFSKFHFFFFFFFFFFFLESESSTLHTLFMKTWSEFLNNVQK